MNVKHSPKNPHTWGRSHCHHFGCPTKGHWIVMCSWTFFLCAKVWNFDHVEFLLMWLDHGIIRCWGASGCLWNHQEWFMVWDSAQDAENEKRQNMYIIHRKLVATLTVILLFWYVYLCATVCWQRAHGWCLSCIHEVMSPRQVRLKARLRSVGCGADNRISTRRRHFCTTQPHFWPLWPARTWGQEEWSIHFFLNFFFFISCSH